MTGRVRPLFGRAANSVVGRAIDRVVGEMSGRIVSHVVGRMIDGMVDRAADHDIDRNVGRVIDGAVGGMNSRIVSRAVGHVIDAVVGRGAFHDSGRLIDELACRVVGDVIRDVIDGVTGRIVNRIVKRVIDGTLGEMSGRIVSHAVGFVIDGMVGRIAVHDIGRLVDRVVGHRVCDLAGGAVGRVVDRVVGNAVVRSIDGVVGRIVNQVDGRVVSEVIDGAVGCVGGLTVGRIVDRVVSRWAVGDRLCVLFQRELDPVVGQRLTGQIGDAEVSVGLPVDVGIGGMHEPLQGVGLTPGGQEVVGIGVEQPRAPRIPTAGLQLRKLEGDNSRIELVEVTARTRHDDGQLDLGTARQLPRFRPAGEFDRPLRAAHGPLDVGHHGQMPGTATHAACRAQFRQRLSPLACVVGRDACGFSDDRDARCAPTCVAGVGECRSRVFVDERPGRDEVPRHGLGDVLLQAT